MKLAEKLLKMLNPAQQNRTCLLNYAVKRLKLSQKWNLAEKATVC